MTFWGSILSSSDFDSTLPPRFNWIHEAPIRVGDQVRACIDWIDVLVRLGRRTNFQTVRRVLDVEYADPLDEDRGGSASVFKLRFHDVMRWEWVKDRLGRLECEFSFSHRPEVVAVEVAIDFAQGDDKERLADIVRHCYSFVQFRPSSENHRAFHIKRPMVAVPESRSLLQEWLQAGDCSIYVGDHDHDDVAYRLYVKATDRRSVLPFGEHRARMEVTLRGAAIPFHTLDDGEAFALERLAVYFRFVRPKPGLSPRQTVMAGALMRFARPPVIRRRDGGGIRSKAGYACANREINARIYEALRDASGRLRSSSVGERRRKFRGIGSAKPLVSRETAV